MMDAAEEYCPMQHRMVPSPCNLPCSTDPEEEENRCRYCPCHELTDFREDC